MLFHAGMLVDAIAVVFASLSSGFRRSKPHVVENLYTMKKTKKLTSTKTHAVTNFANRFKLDSLGSRGRS